MKRAAVGLLVVAVAAVSVGGTLWITGPRRPVVARSGERTQPADGEDRAPTAEGQEQTIAALRRENETLRKAHQACLLARAAGPADSATPEADTDRAVQQALDEDHKRAAEEAGKDEKARTAAWSKHLVSDLGLSPKQAAAVDEIASWAEAQRSALAEKADKDSLDAKAVRDAIAEQRDEYERRMKALLTPAQFQEFDGIQGIDRRPPTFSRVPWILGDRTVAR